MAQTSPESPPPVNSSAPRPSRWDSILARPWKLACYLLLAAPASVLAGLALGKFALPLVQSAAVFPVFYGLLARRRAGAAAVSMLAWALLTAALMIWLTMLLPDVMGRRILLGESYRAEMFEWVATGVGAEGDIRRFLPQHVLHFVLFAAATALSAGYLGLAMGSVLMNYMSFYVGSLLAQSREVTTLALLAWPPWAAVRVVAYILSATAISALACDRAGLFAADFPQARRLLVSGGTLLALDVFLKWWLAPVWQPWLLHLTGW